MSKKSRKTRSRADRTAKFAIPLAYVIVDRHSRCRALVAAPIYHQLLVRGWATPLGHKRAVLVGRLALRSSEPTADFNLQFRSLMKSLGPSIQGSWWRVEANWMYDQKGGTSTPQARQEAIVEDCRWWGSPERKPIVISRQFE